MSTGVIVAIVVLILVAALLTLGITISFLARRSIKIMREGRSIEIEVDMSSAKLYIDRTIVAKNRTHFLKDVELETVVDDMNVKVQIHMGLFRPLIKVFINDEYVDDGEYVKNR